MIVGKPVSLNGDSYTAKQPVGDFRAFLSNGMSRLSPRFSYTPSFNTILGKCGQKGESCPFVEGDLVNPPQMSHASIFVLPYVSLSYSPAVLDELI
jgi:hypothetical protein